MVGFRVPGRMISYSGLPGNVLDRWESQILTMEKWLVKSLMFDPFQSIVVSASPKRWDRWHSPSPNWQEKYHLYIPLIVLAEPGG